MGVGGTGQGAGDGTPAGVLVGVPPGVSGDVGPGCPVGGEGAGPEGGTSDDDDAVSPGCPVGDRVSDDVGGSSEGSVDGAPGVAVCVVLRVGALVGCPEGTGTAVLGTTVDGGQGGSVGVGHTHALGVPVGATLGVSRDGVGAADGAIVGDGSEGGAGTQLQSQSHTRPFAASPGTPSPWARWAGNAVRFAQIFTYGFVSELVPWHKKPWCPRSQARESGGHGGLGDGVDAGLALGVGVSVIDAVAVTGDGVDGGSVLVGRVGDTGVGSAVDDTT